MKNLVIITVLTFLVCLSSKVFAQTQAEIDKYTAGKEERIEWLKEARFGMFIHWGVYSGVSDEWNGERGNGESCFMMEHFKVPYEEYLDKVAKPFNPVKFNAEEWVKIARDAGMKYIVITAKHTDGFAMYPSKASPYNIVDGTAFQRDPLMELRKACDKYGIKLGYYYSQTWDWLHPHALTSISNNSKIMFKDNNWDWPDRSTKDADIYYKEKAYKQVNELMKSYSPAIIWFDVPGDITKEHSYNLLKIVRSQDPNCIINNRIGNGMGDFGSPEQYIPSESNDFFEVCMTIRDYWGYSYFDRNYKSSKTIIRNIVDIAHKGSNYLLNVGPTGEGVFPEQSVRTLQGVGEWMKTYGESIYGSAGSPIGKLPFNGRCTSKPGKLFIHVFDWPSSGKLYVPGIVSQISNVYLMADPNKTKLNYNQVGSDINIELSAAKSSPSFLDEASTVITIEYKGNLEIAKKPALIDPAYAISLTPNDAIIEGNDLKYGFINIWGSIRYGYHVENWYNKDDSMTWKVRSISDGNYDVELTYAAPQGCEGNKFVLSAQNEKITGNVENTGDWNTFKTFLIGSIKLEASESITLSIKPEELSGCSLMDLKEVRLIPIP